MINLLRFNYGFSIFNICLFFKYFTGNRVSRQDTLFWGTAYEFFKIIKSTPSYYIFRFVVMNVVVNIKKRDFLKSKSLLPKSQYLTHFMWAFIPWLGVHRCYLVSSVWKLFKFFPLKPLRRLDWYLATCGLSSTRIVTLSLIANLAWPPLADNAFSFTTL